MCRYRSGVDISGLKIIESRELEKRALNSFSFSLSTKKSAGILTDTAAAPTVETMTGSQQWSSRLRSATTTQSGSASPHQYFSLSIWQPGRPTMFISYSCIFGTSFLSSLVGPHSHFPRLVYHIGTADV